MLNMLKNFFANTLYVKIFANRFEILHIESGKMNSIIADRPFTTHRLLVGQFTEAAIELRKGIKLVYAGRNKLFIASPAILIQPMEMFEGGLSQVEERALQELAMSVGARKAIVHVGNTLTDQEVIAKL